MSLCPASIAYAADMRALGETGCVKYLHDFVAKGESTATAQTCKTCGYRILKLNGEPV